MRKSKLFFVGVISIVVYNALFWNFISVNKQMTPDIPPSQYRTISGNVSSTSVKNDHDTIVVVVVACGEESREEMIVFLKSAILSSTYHGYPVPEFILLTEEKDMPKLRSQVRQLQGQSKRYHLRYKILPVKFPVGKNVDWKGLFRPCSSQRLFLHRLLQNVKEILYIDADSLVLGDLRMIWSKFHEMNSSQAVGMVLEEELSANGVGSNWYRKHAKHPYYPPQGLNAGVMLMNLTRLRNDASLNWEKAIIEAYNKYKGPRVHDQELINILFHNRPDAVYVLPCTFNYRTDQCNFGPHCKAAQLPPPEGKGIQLLHGNDHNFHKPGWAPEFHAMYNYFKEFDMDNGDYIRDIVRPFKREMNSKSKRCGILGHITFNFYTYKSKFSDVLHLVAKPVIKLLNIF